MIIVQRGAGGGGATPPGSDTYVIYNDAGAYGAVSGFTFNKSTKVVTLASGAYRDSSFVTLGARGVNLVTMDTGGTYVQINSLLTNFNITAPTGFNKTAPGAKVHIVAAVPLIGLIVDGVAEFAQIASGGTPTSNSARIYAKDVGGTAEMFVMDEAGNETQISPHAMDAPAAFYDAADDSPYVVKELNFYLGKVRYLNLSRFAAMMQRLINGTNTLAQLQALAAPARQFVYQETFAAYNTRLGANLTAVSWATVQANLQTAYDAARGAEQAALDAWTALPANTRGVAPTVRPVADIRKPVPAWLAARGVV